MSTSSTEPLSREERRRRTESAILDVARRLFAETGFERATIRAVAQRAGIDPALVMQYYGSKEGLFAAAMHGSHGGEEAFLAGGPDDIPGAALRGLLDKFENTGDREAAVALMRNCLTHPEANRIMRDEVVCSMTDGIARAICGEDAELRAALFTACLVGVGLARYMLEVPALSDAARADVERVMEPVLRSLLCPPADQG